MADVLIVGGGIAGSTLAILLGRQGLEVELFERGHFPKEKPCGEGLMPAGVAVLQRLGLAETVGGAPFHGVRYHFAGRTAEGRFPSIAGFPNAGRGQRRRLLDQTLFQAAANTPGITAHMGVGIDALLRENGRVAGVLLEGEPRRTKLVVVADGARSRMRHLLGLDRPLRRKRFGVRAHFRLAPGQTQVPWVDVFGCCGYELYVTPLPDGEVLVAGLAHAGTWTGPVNQLFHSWWRAEPALAARLEGAQQVTSPMSTSPLAGRARAGVAPGVVLLGDAAGFLDPITGGGMAQALVTAELLANYVRRNLGRDDEWLWAFDRERRAMLWDYRVLTQAMLWLSTHRRLAELLIATLRLSPTLFSHLLGVSGGASRLWRPMIASRRSLETSAAIEGDRARPGLRSKARAKKISECDS